MAYPEKPAPNIAQRGLPDIQSADYNPFTSRLAAIAKGIVRDGFDNNTNFFTGAVNAPLSAGLGAPTYTAGKLLEGLGFDSLGRPLTSGGQYLTDNARASANQFLSGLNMDADKIESATKGLLPEHQADFERRNNYGTPGEQERRRLYKNIGDLSASFLPMIANPGSAGTAFANAARVFPGANKVRQVTAPIASQVRQVTAPIANQVRQVSAPIRELVRNNRLFNNWGTRNLAVPAAYTLPIVVDQSIQTSAATRDERLRNQLIANREANQPTPEAPEDLIENPNLYAQNEYASRLNPQAPSVTYADPVAPVAPVSGANVMMPTFRAQRPDTAPNPNLYAQNEYASRLNLREPRARKGSKPAAQGTPPAPSPDAFFQKELRQYADRYGYGVNPERYKLEPAQAPPEVRTERPDVATPPQSNPTPQPATTPSTAAASNMNRRQSDLMQRMNATAGGNNSLYTAGPAPQSMAAPSSVDLAAKMPSSRTQQDRMLTNPSRPSSRAQVNLTNSYNQAQARKQQANQNFLSAGNAQVNGNTSTGTTSLGGSYTRTVDPVTGKRKVVGEPMIGDRALQAGINPANVNTPAGRRRVNVLASNSRAARSANPATQAYRQRLADRRTNALNTRRAMRFGR